MLSNNFLVKTLYFSLALFGSLAFFTAVTDIEFKAVFYFFPVTLAISIYAIFFLKEIKIRREEKDGRKE